MTTEPDATPAAEAEPFRFETALAELEQLVGQLEAGQLSLEDSLDAYRRGSHLLVACRERLDAVRRHVEILDGDVLRAFEGGEGT